MNRESNHKIDKFDPRTLTAILIMSIVEYEVFTFSKTTGATAKQDAWLAVIMGAVTGILIGIFVCKTGSPVSRQRVF